MCGRYAIELALGDEKLAAFLREAGEEVKLGEVRPTDLAPVVVAQSGKTACRAMAWGFPGFADSVRPNAKPRPLINAKSETAQSLPTWADSLKARRCVVPATGYYEWQHGGPMDKQKYLFTSPDQANLYLAGVYKAFPGPDGQMQERFAILTTAASEGIAGIHDRMPVVLTPQECMQWLAGDYKALLRRGGTPMDAIPCDPTN